MCPTFQQTAKIDVPYGKYDAPLLSVMCPGHTGHCEESALHSELSEYVDGVTVDRCGVGDIWYRLLTTGTNS